MKTLTTLILICCSLSLSAQILLEKKYRAEKSQVRSFTFTPDSKQIIVGAKNRLNIFQSGSTNVLQKSIKTGLNNINSVQLISKNEALITSENAANYNWSNTIQYVNITTEKVYKTTFISKRYKKITQIEAIQSSNKIAFISEKKLYLMNDTVVTIIDNIQNFTAIDYSVKTKQLYGSTEDGKILEFNILNLQFKEIFSKSKMHIKSIGVSENGKRIAFADRKNDLLVLDKDKNFSAIQLNKKKYKKEFTNLTFSFDSKYLATSNRGKFQVWNINDNFLTFNKLMKKNNFIASDIQFTPSGQYLAISSLGSKTVRLWNCQKLNISPSIDYKNESDKTPPQIVVTNPRIVGDKVSVTNESITLQGLTIDNYGTRSVSVNGTKCTLTSTGSFEINMDLALGNNFVNILATDVNGNSETKKFSIIRKEFDLDALSFESKNHLLIISIDKYKDWPQLNNAVSDAKRFENVLQERYNFANENIVRITDTLGSKQNIINGFKKMIANVGPNDNVIIYYSGHGFFDPEIGEGYWVPFDAEKGNDAAYLPNSFMMQLMKKINSKHIFLIADACFSGSLFAQSNRGYTENVGNFKSRWGLASGRLELVSDGAAGTQSPFNKYLVQFLSTNTKESFAVSELVQYVKINVANETDQAPVGNPLQNIGDEGGEFIFKLETE